MANLKQMIIATHEVVRVISQPVKIHLYELCNDKDEEALVKAMSDSELRSWLETKRSKIELVSGLKLDLVLDLMPGTERQGPSRFIGSKLTQLIKDK